MNVKEFFNKVLIASEYLVGLTCLAYVCFLSYYSISTFELHQTAQNFETVYHDKVPSITTCLSKGYKNYVNCSEDFTSSLLKEDDIGPIEENRKSWKIDTFFSPFYGQCYTYHHIGRYNYDADLEFPQLVVKRNHAFRVFFHEPGFEIFIQYDVDLPNQITSLNMSKEEFEGFTTFYFQYSIKTSVHYPSARKPCGEDITLNHFKQCMIEYLSLIAHDTWKPYVNQSVNDVSHPELYDPPQLLKDWKALSTFVQNASIPTNPQTCTFPCNETSYFYTKLKLHENVFAQFTSKWEPMGNSRFFFGYSGKTEVATEYLFMNINGLISAIGGNVGMFLGFSAYSIYQKISEKVRSLCL